MPRAEAARGPLPPLLLASASAPASAPTSQPAQLRPLRSEHLAELKNRLMMERLMRLRWFREYRARLAAYRADTRGAPPAYPSDRVDEVERDVDRWIVEHVDAAYDSGRPGALHEAWLRACARGEATTLQATVGSLPAWHNMDADDKARLLHRLALNIDGYRTPYTHSQVAVLRREHQASVEHVVPRSHFKDPKTALGPRDPNGWVVAAQRANSARGNSPLTLWPRIDQSIALGHYRPPFEERARLARKWLYMRYTYSDGLDLETHPPSKAQIVKAALIAAWVRDNPPDEAEMLMNDAVHAELGWSNPLLDRDEAVRNRFLDSPEFRTRAFRVR